MRERCWLARDLITPRVTILDDRFVPGCDTESLATGQRTRRFTGIEWVARRKLRQLEIAGRLDDLRVPLGNRLEMLKGDRAIQYSIRINDQYRLCFRWTAAGPADVGIVDYH